MKKEHPYHQMNKFSSSFSSSPPQILYSINGRHFLNKSYPHGLSVLKKSMGI
ncbi:hypothetical protein H312_01701 [Anncaliia algerae PRA339]|uniref:Uncharacterized protein n=1 Tax=Anncaliia algerae PRA339 TaxID=1288291 RepID=A0A059F0P1_9MICR|nr:hypothetical protein H312_01701 [Anncaliia algerae PRA339]